MNFENAFRYRLKYIFGSIPNILGSRAKKDGHMHQYQSAGWLYLG